MGTRNVTSVIVNGKQLVCQYGQWDGYPSYTGAKILDFLRDVDMARFKQALANTKISATAFQKAKTYTGSTKDVHGILVEVEGVQASLNQNRTPDTPFIGTYDTVKHMLAHNLLTQQEADAFIVSTRDTGCAILSYLYDRSLDLEPLQLFAMKNDYDGKFDSDIQGVYVIDLDSMIVKMRYDGYARQYDIHHLPQKIALEMQVYEAITKKMYELSYGKFDFSTLVSDTNHEEYSDVLKEKALSIAMAVAAEIRERYPHLITAPEKSIQAEDYGLDYICSLLREKGLTAKQKTKQPFLAQVQAAEESATLVAKSTTHSTSLPEPER